jgi:hypothetical protein
MNEAANEPSACAPHKGTDMICDQLVYKNNVNTINE